MITTKNITKRNKNWKKRLLDHTAFEVLISLTTIYALFGDDIRMATCTLAQDKYFDITTTVSIFLFIFEIYLASCVRKHFLFSFFFWLDLISSLTLIFDITIINHAVLGT